jgi:hypothetical protein
MDCINAMSLRRKSGQRGTQHLGGVQVHPGLTSWATLSRPYGTDRDQPDS